MGGALHLGVPMYSNAAAIIPVIAVLTEQGAALRTVLAFMMSVFVLYLPALSSSVTYSTL